MQVSWSGNEATNPDADDATKRAALRGLGLLPPVADGLWEPLPEYAELLTVRHELHRASITKLVSTLPRTGGRVMDVACGDGFLTRLLVEHDPLARVSGLDASPDYLALAREAYVGERATLREGDAGDLPVDDGALRMIWCGHSLRSLPEPEDALREWVRALGPGGVLALLENDRLHQLLLPWPPEVELAVYRADRDQADGTLGGGLDAGRRAATLLDEAGLRVTSRRTWTTELTTNPTERERTWLALWLEQVWDRTHDAIDAEQRDEAARWMTPEGDRWMAADPHLEGAWVDVLVVARKG